MKLSFILLSIFVLTPSLFNSSKNVDNLKFTKSHMLEKDDQEVTINVLNWADYIYKEDEQDSEERRTNERFNAWLEENYPEFGHVNVSYNTSDTCETMLSEMKTGKSNYDLLCPSDYGIQRLLSEGYLTSLKDKMEAYGLSNYSSYSSRTLIDYMENIKSTNGLVVNDYAVGYMWGTLGIIFNAEYDLFSQKGITPEEVIEDMSDYSSLWDKKYEGAISIKDSMRDSYFVGLAEVYKSELLALLKSKEEGEIDSSTYSYCLNDLLNKNDDETIKKVKSKLEELKSTIFGMEVDSGKQEIVMNYIGVNVAWSGDAVYSMDLADLDNLTNNDSLCYSVPYTGANIWFDGWCMPKNESRSLKQEQASCLFLDFLCDPEIARENMEYIGYTSFIGGDQVLDYVRDCYDLRSELIYYFDEDSEEYYDLYYQNKIDGSEVLVSYEDCFFGSELDSDFDEVELYYYDCNDEKIFLEETYNERLMILEENSENETLEKVDLSYFFKDTLSEEYEKEGDIYSFYSYCYLPFKNADGSKNTSVGRQFFCQYPDEETISRCVVMRDFGDQNDKILKMWEDFKSNSIPTWIIIVFASEISIGGVCLAIFLLRKKLVKSLRKRRREDRKKE